MDLVATSLPEILDVAQPSPSETVVYRGQAQADWGLVPTLYRGLESADEYGRVFAMQSGIERDLYRELRDKSAGLRENGMSI